MGRPCTVCQHPERHQIDRALVAGDSLRNLALSFGLSDTAVFRHRTNHLPALLVKAREAADQVHAAELQNHVQAHEQETVAQAIDVVNQLKAINGASLAILVEAREAKDHDVALKAIDRVHRQIELQAKLLGDLDERPTVNVLLAPEWLNLRAVIVQALEHHPEARLAVVNAMAGVKNGR